MLRDYSGRMMFRFSPLLLGALVCMAGAPAPAQAQHHPFSQDQNSARRDLLDGKVMPFSMIKRKVEQEMGDATYVGTAPPPREGVYRMQFLRKDGRVIWVDVDAHSGNIIGKTK